MHQDTPGHNYCLLLLKKKNFTKIVYEYSQQGIIVQEGYLGDRGRVPYIRGYRGLPGVTGVGRDCRELRFKGR